MFTSPNHCCKMKCSFYYMRAY